MNSYTAPQIDRQKIRSLLLIGFLFTLGVSITLNRVPFIRAKSDIYLRWYATTKLFSEDRNLYDEDNGKEVQQIVYGDNPVSRKTNFYYPAHLLIFTAPLSLLPYPAAHLIWTTAVQLFYLSALWLLIRELRWPDTTNRITLLLVMAALFLPNLQHTIWGQFNTIGVLSLVLSFLALRWDRYGMAGVWAAGLTFKPQATLLPLVFLLFWVLWGRRWRFFLGFALTMAAMWAFAEILQPGWVFDFIDSLEGYIPVRSAVDQIGNPYQLISGALLFLLAIVLLQNRNAPADSVAFAGCLSLSILVWGLIIPIVGMMHTVLFIPAVILLLASLKSSQPRLYRPALIALCLVYIGGWLLFIWGLTDQALYGQHIVWSEMVYRVVLPIIIGLFSLPLCLSRQYRTERLSS